MKTAVTVPDGHQIVANIAWESVHEVVDHLRKGGVHPICQNRPNYVWRLTRQWQWRTEPKTQTTTLSVPADEVQVAKRLLAEWRQQEHERLRPIVAQIRRGVVIAALGMVALGTALWLILGDVDKAVAYAFVVALFALFITSYLRKL